MTGGGGGSSSSTTTTTQQDERIAASDQAVVVQVQDGSTIEVVDPGIVNLVEEGLAGLGNLISETIDFAGNESAKANKIVEKALSQNQSEDKQNFGGLLKWGVVMTLGVAAVKVLGGK